MQLKDIHPDMCRYLQEDCYCPNEIYDKSGFFCMLFPAESVCEVIAHKGRIISCIATDEKTLDKAEPKNIQLLNFYLNEAKDRILDAFRLDATKNNIEVVKRLCQGNVKSGDKWDEYKPGTTQANLEELFSICDLIIRD